MSRRRPHLITPAALLLLAWGVFAFGAVYTWAHAPLLTFALAVSALGFIAARGIGEGALRAYRLLAICLALLVIGTTLQIVPLPASVVAAVAPARDDADFRTLYAQSTLREVDAAAAPQPPRTLSIAPSRTRLGLAFVACLGVLLLGAARGFTAVRPTTFLRGVIIIGVLAAFAELVQLTLTGQARGFAYGVFPPINSNFEPAAPFMNRNHTAGFLVMAAAGAMGYLASCVAVGWRRVKPEWRERMLWFASREGSESVLVGFAIMVMTTGVIATQSRSGFLTLGLAFLLFGYVVVRRQWSRAVKTIVLVAAVLAITGAAGFAGLDGIAKRLAAISMDDPGERSAIWGSAIRQARDFPLTGTGLNTFGVASIHYQDPTLRLRSRDIEAHNDYLQLASEGGLLLGIPALAAILSLGILIRRRFNEGRDDVRIYWVRVGAVIALAAIACQALVEFTLQMPGAATMFVLLAAVAVHRPS